MHVGNENMIDLTPPDLVFRHLQLGAFPTIDQEKIILGLQHLCCGVPAKSWYGRIVS